MRRTARHLLAVTLLVTVLGACGDDDPGDGAQTAASSTTSAPADTTTAPAGDETTAPGGVRIVDFTFDPAEVTVAAGTTVTWVNADEAVHSVADSELGFESEDLAQGDAFEHTYDEAGEFPYICGIHDYMQGTVIVE